jgi:3-dehydroquinate synthase
LFRNLENSLLVKSGQETYEALFVNSAIDELIGISQNKRIFVLADRNVAGHHSEFIGIVKKIATVIITINPIENSKQLVEIPKYINLLLDAEIRRGDLLVGIGGGIIQDITGFIATILFRGLNWIFIPTTLAAQADSCIGSKTSINLGHRKNTLGTYHHAEKIIISTEFLRTLSVREIRAGLGEMLKVHAIEDKNKFDEIASSYSLLLNLKGDLTRFIYQSLEFKRKKIEIDEKDQGPRLVMNYGHSFGHALEAASNFQIPHGIAVSMGMDIANHISVKLSFGTKNDFDRMHPILIKNSNEFWNKSIDRSKFSKALLADKKNTLDSYIFILIDKLGVPSVKKVSMDVDIDKLVFNYIEDVRANEFNKK